MKRILYGIGTALGISAVVVFGAASATTTPRYVDMYVDTLDSPATNTVLTVRDCTQVRELRLYDGGELVAVGKRVARPPYVCQFVWQP
jgi:hypothetical protein